MKTKIGGDALTSIEVLKTIDKEKSPKLYATTERLAKAEELAQNYKIRAEKAEKAKKPLETETPIKPTGEDTPKKSTLSPEDVYALIEAKVPKEDIDEVKVQAKAREVSITEILGDRTMQTILRERAEERKTAQATNTGGGKRGSSKVSDETLLAQVEKGELPEEDMERAAKARIKQKQKGA